MTPPSQEVESPDSPGRFIAPVAQDRSMWFALAQSGLWGRCGNPGRGHFALSVQTGSYRSDVSRRRGTWGCRTSLPVVAQIDCELTLAGSSGVNFEADSQDSARIRTSTGAEQEVRPFREITCVPQERMSNGNTW